MIEYGYCDRTAIYLRWEVFKLESSPEDQDREGTSDGATTAANVILGEAVVVNCLIFVPVKGEGHLFKSRAIEVGRGPCDLGTLPIPSTSP